MNHTPTTDRLDDSTHQLTWYSTNEGGESYTRHNEYFNDEERCTARAFQLHQAGKEGILITTL